MFSTRAEGLHTGSGVASTWVTTSRESVYPVDKPGLLDVKIMPAVLLYAGCLTGKDRRLGKGGSLTNIKSDISPPGSMIKTRFVR